MLVASSFLNHQVVPETVLYDHLSKMAASNTREVSVPHGFHFSSQIEQMSANIEWYARIELNGYERIELNGY